MTVLRSNYDTTDSIDYNDTVRSILFVGTLQRWVKVMILDLKDRDQFIVLDQLVYLDL